MNSRFNSAPVIHSFVKLLYYMYGIFSELLQDERFFRIVLPLDVHAYATAASITLRLLTFISSEKSWVVDYTSGSKTLFSRRKIFQ